MKLLAGLLYLAAGLAAALTTVTGTVQDSNGNLVTGRAYIDLSGTCIGSGGAVIVNPTKIVTITAGAFSADLEPSLSCNPAQYYRVRYQVAGWNAPLEFWNVPISVVPVTIASVRISGAPVTGTSIGISGLTGLTCKGDMIASNGSATIRVPCGATGRFLGVDASAPSGVSWQVPSGGGGGSIVYGRYSATITPAATTWTVTGPTHGLGTCALAFDIWVSNLAVEPATISCNNTTFDVSITFSSALTGDVFLTSDPVFVADSLMNGSLVSQVVTQPFTAAASTTVTHNLNAVVILRCYQENGIRLFYNTATRLSANAISVTFTGSPSGFCVAGR